MINVSPDRRRGFVLSCSHAPMCVGAHTSAPSCAFAHNININLCADNKCTPGMHFFVNIFSHTFICECACFSFRYIFRNAPVCVCLCVFERVHHGETDRGVIALLVGLALCQHFYSSAKDSCTHCPSISTCLLGKG